MFGCLFIFCRHSTTCLDCLCWQAWWFVTKKLRAAWTLNWNIQTKAIGILKKTHLFQPFSNNLYRTTKETYTLKWLHPSLLKSQMWLLFMAVHSRYGHHYLKDILCSTDLWRGRGSEKFTLPHLMQDMSELVHINRDGVVFSYLLSKNLWEPNLESGWQEICDDPSSVRSGTVVLQSVVPGLMVCLCQLGSSEWCRVVFYHWGGYMLTHIITDLPP